MRRRTATALSSLSKSSKRTLTLWTSHCLQVAMTVRMQLHSTSLLPRKTTRTWMMETTLMMTTAQRTFPPRSRQSSTQMPQPSCLRWPKPSKPWLPVARWARLWEWRSRSLRSRAPTLRPRMQPQQRAQQLHPPQQQHRALPLSQRPALHRRLTPPHLLAHHVTPRPAHRAQALRSPRAVRAPRAPVPAPQHLQCRPLHRAATLPPQRSPLPALDHRRHRSPAPQARAPRNLQRRQHQVRPPLRRHRHRPPHLSQVRPHGAPQHQHLSARTQLSQARHQHPRRALRSQPPLLLQPAPHALRRHHQHPLPPRCRMWRRPQQSHPHQHRQAGQVPQLHPLLLPQCPRLQVSAQLHL
mmetsp:Transcript_4506/g.9780  ORF Transcript_4506/g.9780 Transcript_4506/m.9780 type:complete len:354 (+) Transcript_4506:253-1314(+)